MDIDIHVFVPLFGSTVQTKVLDCLMSQYAIGWVSLSELNVHTKIKRSHTILSCIDKLTKLGITQIKDSEIYLVRLNPKSRIVQQLYQLHNAIKFKL